MIKFLTFFLLHKFLFKIPFALNSTNGDIQNYYWNYCYRHQNWSVLILLSVNLFLIYDDFIRNVRVDDRMQHISLGLKIIPVFF